MNVLIYSGPGTTAESVRHCLATFRELLSPRYAVMTVDAKTIVTEPWQGTCALLCIPGGADLGFCKALNGEGNRNIKRYVQRGGIYIGFCAGAYYASEKVEFEQGNRSLEVVGSRELGFFPGVCRGAAFGGFQYNSESGARACHLSVSESLTNLGAPPDFLSYHNGGGLFVNAEEFRDSGVEVMATYLDIHDIAVGGGFAAAIKCKVGAGYSLQIAPHPEFLPSLMKTGNRQTPSAILDALESHNHRRKQFLHACFINLRLNSDLSGADLSSPSLSKLHLICPKPQDLRDLTTSLRMISDQPIQKDGLFTIHGGNDSFLLETRLLSLDSIKDEYDAPEATGNSTHVIVHSVRTPPLEAMPHFDTLLYFQELERQQERWEHKGWGHILLYGEVVTSTNTILDSNFKLLQRLPTGFTAVATRQTAGRGRGANVWVTPFGVLAFSTVIRHQIGNHATSPVVFIQYLAALAILDAIKTYGPGYEELPVKLKWPNDLYALTPTSPTMSEKPNLAKIGGILVNASFVENEFLLVVGCGINVSNNAPTISLRYLVDAANDNRRSTGQSPLDYFEQERLLAKILTLFESFYKTFKLSGFLPFHKQYLGNWVHTNQMVTIESEANAKARIRGISLEDGLLLADEVDEQGSKTGKTFTLQSDGNSFDFMNGLLRKK